jgi:hypothetical protein
VMHESGTYVKFTQAARNCSHDDMHPLRGLQLTVLAALQAPCPVCNATNDRDAPRLPEGSKTEVDKEGWRY